MGITLSRVDPADDDAIDAYHSVAAASAADVPDLPAPTLVQVAGAVRYPPPTIIRDHIVAYQDGEPVGTLRLNRPTADNRHLITIELGVHPHRRRRGVGRYLFTAAVDHARTHGRSLIITQYCVPLESGPYRDPAPAAFAAAVGAQPALTEVRRRLNLTTVDMPAWQARYHDALRQARGYTVRWWAGAAPDDLAAGVAYLEGRMVTDAPMGDLRFEPERYDTDRIRATEEALRQRRQRHYHAGVVDDGTGRLAGWSALFFEPDERAHAWQGTTIVDPDHRGHRLGLLLKLENLIRTREVEPELRHVDTWNAVENAHMIAINEAIGFRPVDAWVECQYDIPAATGAL